MISPDYAGTVHLTTKNSATGYVFVDAELQMQDGNEHALLSACVIDVIKNSNSVLPTLNVSKSNLYTSKGEVAARGS